MSEKHKSFQFLVIHLRKTSIIFLSVFLFAQVVSAQLQSKIIESLEVIGNQKLTDKEILSHIKTRSSQFLDKKQLDKDLENLLLLGWFDERNTKVLIEKGANKGVAVIFEVRELSIVEEVKYKGLKFVKKEEVIAELKRHKLNIQKGDSYDSTKLLKVQHIVSDYLKTRGFEKAKVAIYENTISGNSAVIEIVFEETK